MAQHDAPQVRVLTVEQLEQRDARQLELAKLLHSFVYGEDTDWDEETRSNYLSDADDILNTHPHLLPLPLRWDMFI
jgi:hypothetical protein